MCQFNPTDQFQWLQKHGLKHFEWKFVSLINSAERIFGKNLGNKQVLFFYVMGCSESYKHFFSIYVARMYQLGLAVVVQLSRSEAIAFVKL